jgi:hypothetical protein
MSNTEDKDMFQDPEKMELDLKMSKIIDEMPEEVKDRFKALKVIYDEYNDMDEEEQAEYRKLELKYESKYAQIYSVRSKILNDDSFKIPEELISEFNKRAEELKDDGFKDLEYEKVDVKEIQNCPNGVPGFWLRAMLGQPLIGSLI